MNEIDKISKDSRTLLESARDTFANNIVEAVKTKKFAVDEKSLQTIIAIANLSIDEGYQKALPSFQKSLRRTLETYTLDSKKKK